MLLVVVAVMVMVVMVVVVMVMVMVLGSHYVVVGVVVGDRTWYVGARARKRSGVQDGLRARRIAKVFLQKLAHRNFI